MTRLARLYSPMARYLREHHNVDCVLLTYSKSQLPSRELFGFCAEDFSEIVVLEDLFEREKNSNSAISLYERTDELETRTGVSVLDVLRTDRHLGIGFVPGARFMRSQFGVSYTYEDSISLVLRLCERIESLLIRHKPIAVLGVPGSIASAAMAALANGQGIPMRALNLTRDGKRVFWAVDEHSTPAGFEEAFQKRLASTQQEENDAMPDFQVDARTKRTSADFLKRAKFSQLIVDVVQKVRGRISAIVRKRTKTYGNYLFSHWLAMLIERWWWRRRALRQQPVLDTLPEDLPFVLFPLHVEPEATMMVESQMCDNQLALIDWTTKSIPAGWYVVVKEHPGATAPRPPGFWWRIRQYPNVIVAGTLENAERYIARSRAVACISGTVGLQAAVLGLPVVTFHPRFIGLHLPHVMHADSYNSTRSAIKLIRSDGLPSLAERQRCVRALLAALVDCAFEIDDHKLVSGSPIYGSVSENDVASISDSLLASLKPGDSSSVPQEAVNA